MSAPIEITQDSVQIARLEEQLATVRRDLEAVQTSMGELQQQLGQVLAKLNEAKGGWRVLMLFGGASAALGSAIPWLLAHIKFTP
mgnify:CR=1 FL=1